MASEMDGWILNRFGRPCGSAQSGVFATGPPLRNMWRCGTPRWRRWANIENTLILNSTDWKRATFWTKLCCAPQIKLDFVHIFNLTCLQLKRVICRRRWEAILQILHTTSLAVGTHDCCALVAGDLSYFVPSKLLPSCENKWIAIREGKMHVWWNKCLQEFGNNPAM